MIERPSLLLVGGLCKQTPSGSDLLEGPSPLSHGTHCWRSWSRVPNSLWESKRQ